MWTNNESVDLALTCVLAVYSFSNLICGFFQCLNRPTTSPNDGRFKTTLSDVNCCGAFLGVNSRTRLVHADGAVDPDSQR